MNIDPTASNRALAAAVNSRINADARIVNAKAAMWRLAGVGILAALAGVGVGAALYGYASIHDATNTAERLAGAISTAIEKTHLKGEVRIAPDQSVRLDPQAEVGLRKGGEVGVHGAVSLEDGGVVRIDPNSRIEVTGVPGTTGSIPHPSEKQLQGSGSAPQPATVVRNYTIFTTVPFGDGSVVTGWIFETSEQAQPTQQYCYYGSPIQDAVQVRVDLAYDGVALPVKKSSGFDAEAAVTQCSWFDGRATRHTAVEMPQPPSKPRPPAEPDSRCQSTLPGTIRTWCIEELGRGGTPAGDRKGKVY